MRRTDCVYMLHLHNVRSVMTNRTDGFFMDQTICTEPNLLSENPRQVYEDGGVRYRFIDMDGCSHCEYYVPRRTN